MKVRLNAPESPSVQSRQLGQLLIEEGVDVDLVVVSPLTRTLQVGQCVQLGHTDLSLKD